MINSTSPVTAGPPVTPVSAAANINAVNALALENQIFELQFNEQISGQNGTIANNDNVLLTSDLLNLSPQAVAILNGINSGVTTGTPVGSVAANASIGETLAGTQQQAINTILAEFSGAPFSAETFAQLQARLTASDISPQQLTLQSMLLAFETAPFGGFAFNAQAITDTLATEDMAA